MELISWSLFGLKTWIKPVTAGSVFLLCQVLCVIQSFTSRWTLVQLYCKCTCCFISLSYSLFLSGSCSEASDAAADKPRCYLLRFIAKISSKQDFRLTPLVQAGKVVSIVYLFHFNLLWRIYVLLDNGISIKLISCLPPVLRCDDVYKTVTLKHQ